MLGQQRRKAAREIWQRRRGDNVVVVAAFGNRFQTRGFRLDPKFVKEYETKKAPFGFNGLGELVYHRTYARKLENGRRERWHETVERVVNGTFSMQERWIKDNVLGWEEQVAQKNAREMYERIYNMKMLPPGRGLWCMGTAVTEKRGLFAALNNCAFISTDTVDKNFAEPFCFTMDASMLGVGVGFDTKGSNLIQITKPKGTPKVFTVADSREGWVASLAALLESYNGGKREGSNSSSSNINKRPLEFDYSNIRKEGEPIKGFGGTSSGPRPLIELHQCIKEKLDALDGKPLSVTAIVDMMNLIGRCVVAGNVRRTAEIAFGDAESKEYMDLKNYEVNPHRVDYGWTSNNSVFAKLGMDYSDIAERIKKNGEPGFAWLENMRNYGRMNGELDTRDWRAGGGNPCLEQTLESHELCCLVETFPNHHTDIEDYKKTLESAILYAKTVTLGKTHWPKSNRVMLRNRRIGCSMSGIAQFIGDRGLHELQSWADQGYEHVQKCDEKVSEWLVIPKSIKTTCIKPSGTVSLLAGATPGMHAPESRFYIRRVRISKGSELIAPLEKAGYHIEPAETDPENTIVVSIPIDAGEGVRTSKQLSMWEQLSLAAYLQRYWADNQVSCTVTFDAKTEGDSLVHALDVFQYQLKGVSFLPRLELGAYAQMPYEEITKEKFLEMREHLKELDLSALSQDYREQEQEQEQEQDEEQDEQEVVVALHKMKPRGGNSENSISSDDPFANLATDDGVGIMNLPDSFCEACNTGDDGGSSSSGSGSRSSNRNDLKKKASQVQ